MPADMPMQFSTVPFLLLSLVGFIGWLAFRARRQGAIDHVGLLRVWGLLGVLVGWAGASAWLALSGVYASEGFLRLLPGLWLPAVPFVVMLLPVAASQGFRRTLLAIFDVTPARWLIQIHALRILALGTLIKTMQGGFPLHFELGVGVADLAFGFSALSVARAHRRSAMSWRGLAIWHGLGFAVVALPAPVLLQLGLPGALKVFDAIPDSTALLVYPMVLAPTAVVPLFLVLNLWSAAWLWVRRPSELRD